MARELGLTQPSVSRAVAQLERELGTRLFHRTTRRVALTDAGRRLYERAGPPSRELGEALEEIRAGSTRLTGTVKVAAPGAMGRVLVVPAVASFLARHPRCGWTWR